VQRLHHPFNLTFNTSACPGLDDRNMARAARSAFHRFRQQSLQSRNPGRQGQLQTNLRHSGLTDRKTPTDPLRSYKGPKRSGRWVAAAAGFRGVLIPVKKSGFGTQSFDLIKFFGGRDGQNIPHCPAYPAGSAAYITLGHNNYHHAQPQSGDKMALPGALYVGMERHEVVEGTESGRMQMIGTLRGLEKRLLEKLEEFSDGSAPSPKEITRVLNLHPRIADVTADLFEDGYHWEAVFAASKALVNFVKERSGQHQLDGTGLVRTVFSRNNPILAFNDLQDQTDTDEQEGMMHLFEGAVLGIRNPGVDSFPKLGHFGTHSR